MLNVTKISDQASGLRKLNRNTVTRVVAVTAGKGGVGKTTVSLNLALALTKLNHNVMILDGDLGLANIDVMLGLHAKYNLSHVIDNKCELEEIILKGPLGLKIIPAASGIEKMTQLGAKGCSGIIHAFNSLTEPLDYLIVDTAAGIADDVCSFSRSAHEVIIVVCDEPTSITDAYALMKVLSKRYKVQKFHVLANMVREPAQGRALFSKLYRVTEQFLDVTLDYLGFLSFDEFIHQSIKLQQGIITAFPNSLGARELKRIADKINLWPFNNYSIDNQSFFLEKLIENHYLSV